MAKKTLWTESRITEDAHIKGVVFHYNLKQKPGAPDAVEFFGMVLPKGTPVFGSGMFGGSLRVAAENQLFGGSVTYFMLGGKVYRAERSQIKPAPKSRIRTQLEHFSTMSIDKMPALIEKLRKGDAKVFRTYGNGQAIILYKGVYFNIGCGNGFDILLKEKIITKSGTFTKKGRFSPESIVENRNMIEHFIQQMAQMEAGNA